MSSQFNSLVMDLCSFQDSVTITLESENQPSNISLWSWYYLSIYRQFIFSNDELGPLVEKSLVLLSDINIWRCKFSVELRRKNVYQMRGVCHKLKVDVKVFSSLKTRVF